MLRLLLLLPLLTALQGQTIHVNSQAPGGGNGSAIAPFDNLPDAVAYANTLSRSVNIRIAPGRYEITETLRIERGMTLTGANRLELDAQGWPTGVLSNPVEETLLVAGPTLTPGTMMIWAGKPGSVIRGVKFRGLTFRSGVGTPNLLDFARVQDFEVRECLFQGAGLVGSAVNTFASSGTIRGNYTTGLLGAAFIGAGYAGSPADVVFRDNRSVGNLVGMFLVGTSDGIGEPGDRLDVEVRHNDLSYNFAGRLSVGIRIIIKGREGIGAGYEGTGLSTGNIRAEIRENRLVGNKIGVAIDGGFVTRRQLAPPANVCDTRTFTGTLDLTLRGNHLSESTFRPTIISFTQFQATLTVLEGLPPNYSASQFLHFGSYSIDDRDGILAAAYIDHPATDPFVGPPCGSDTIHEALNNTLRFNGSLVANTAP